MTKDEENLEKYKILINARNFHYENFNKWMTYFYVAMGAIFVGYCTLLTQDNIDSGLQFMVLLLGFIVSVFWYWSSKGYYYWNINFITLVNNFEEKILKYPEEERIYFVFANKNMQNDYLNPTSGANISTSKVAILFSFIVSCFWGALFFTYCLSLVTCVVGKEIPLHLAFCLFSGLFVHILSGTIARKYLFSYTKHFPDLEIENIDWKKQTM